MELSSHKPKKLFTIFKKKLVLHPRRELLWPEKQKKFHSEKLLIFLQKIFSPRFGMNTDQAIEGKSSNTPA